jgi:hypothetical protein
VILFFRENNGDYLAINTATNRYYLKMLGKDHFECRATAIEGLVGSVCSTAVSREYLEANSKRVAKASVPAEWRRAIGFER